MKGAWGLGVLLACACAAEGGAQVNERREPERCPAVRPSSDLDLSRPAIPKPVALLPPANWKTLMPGSQIYCEDFNAEDRNLGLIRSRSIVEYGIDKGVEFKIDYGLGAFYVARGQAQNLRAATAVNTDISGPYWRGTCAVTAGKYSCTFDSGEGLQVVQVDDLPDLGLKFDFCRYSGLDFRPEQAILTTANGQPVAAAKPAGCTTYDLGAPGRALLHAAESTGYVDVALQGKNGANDAVEVKRRVVFSNAQTAYQLARKIIDSQSRGAPRP